MAVKMMYPKADAHLLMEYAGLPGDIADPFSLGIASYRRCAADIWRAVNAIADNMMKQRS